MAFVSFRKVRGLIVFFPFLKFMIALLATPDIGKCLDTGWLFILAQTGFAAPIGDLTCLLKDTELTYFARISPDRSTPLCQSKKTLD